MIKKLSDNIFTIVTSTLALVIIAVISVLLAGLFNDKVDNQKIFEILTPAFDTIVGCFIGLISGRMYSSNEAKKE